ncbi:MAG: peptidase MA family metallohydrolase [Candidatus Kappaea frigidicola]|nr:peptidase MA family metallohydrolase [Candidatus Kappaea frigidicola]
MQLNKPKLISCSIIFIIFLNIGFCYAQEHKEIKKNLPQTLQRMHFIIYHNDKSYANKVSWKAEFCYKKIIRHFAIDGFRPWEKKSKCRIYLFENRDDYIRLSGAPTWSGGCAMDDPPRLFIYKGAPKLIENTLPHEITHLIFHLLIPREKIPLWLDEGMAQYEEDDWDNGYVRGYLKNSVDEGVYIHFDELFYIKNYPSKQEKKNLFYAESASIIGYLRKQQIASLYGNFILKIRHGKSVDQALKETYHPKFKNGISDLEKYWIKYIQTKY